MMSTRGLIWMLAGFAVVLAATLVPRVGVSLLATLASLLLGAAASVLLGKAAHRSAATAARASAIAGVGAFMATIIGFPVVAYGDTSLTALLGLWGTLLVGVGLGVLNVGVSILGGTLAWLAVGEPVEAINNQLWRSRS